MKRRVLLAAAAAAGVAAMPLGTMAQAYPTKPITMIVPFAAGGPTDALARVLGQRMSEALGQQIVIENIGGAYLVGTELKLTMALVIIVAVLTVKPSGILGKTVQSRV